MRLILFISGLLILGNLVVYLVSSNTQAKNDPVFSHKPEIAPDTMDIVGQRLEVTSPVQKLQTSQLSSPVSNGAALRNKCYRVGPFMHSSRLSIAKTKLNNLNLLFDVEKRPSNTAEVFRIYLGPYEDSYSASLARQQLTEKGIFDHFQRKEQESQYVVSLGIYSRSVSAQSSLERFSEMGIDARMRPERTVLPSSYWLNIASKDQNFSASNMSQIDWGEYSAQFGSYKC